MTIGIGLIGAGVMGSDHAHILGMAVAGVELVAVSDPDAARTARIVETSGAARVIADPLALVRDDRVEAVIVASPDDTHGRLALACLELGKPVLCEKPLAPSTEECLAVVAREVALGRRLVTVGYMRRFDPGYVEMKRRLDSGELGAALLMHCVHRNAVAPSYTTSQALLTNSAVHEIDIARFVLGREVVQITVVQPRRTRLARMQDPQLLLLELDDGVVVEAEVFMNAQYGYDVRAELVCERGAITLTPPHDVTLLREAQEGFGFPSDWRARFLRAYQTELQAWVGALRGGPPVGASAWDGYVATAVATAGFGSLASGQPAVVELAPRPALYG